MRVDGHALADEVLGRLVGRGVLATFVVADDELSHRQAALKHRACERVGLGWREVALPGDTSTEQAVAALAALAEDAAVDGIFVHLPLPPQVDEASVLTALPPAKDVDGLRDDSPFLAASAVATLEVLRGQKLASSRVVVVGDPSSLTRGLLQALTPSAAHVELVSPSDPGVRDRCREADVVVAAAYRPGLVDASWVRAGAAVVDAASGDVDADSVDGHTGLLCASPGGIGPVTVAYLLVATERAAADRAASHP